MQQWLNRSHPQTLQAAVILGYLSAFFGLLSGDGLSLLLAFGLGFGAFFTANNRRAGYIVLAVSATIAAARLVILLALVVYGRDTVATMLAVLNACVFPVALAAAVLHIQSREYQKIWFE
jgi:hypothetical protein